MVTAQNLVTVDVLQTELMFDEARVQPSEQAPFSQRASRYIQPSSQGEVLGRCVCGLTQRPPHCDGSHRELYES